MKRLIKFRAREKETNQIVYGLLDEILGNPEFSAFTFFGIDGKWHFVDADSLEQLIAIDKNGKEVFENDCILPTSCAVDVGFSFLASFYDYAAILGGRAFKVNLPAQI